MYKTIRSIISHIKFLLNFFGNIYIDYIYLIIVIKIKIIA